MPHLALAVIAELRALQDAGQPMRAHRALPAPRRPRDRQVARHGHADRAQEILLAQPVLRRYAARAGAAASACRRPGTRAAVLRHVLELEGHDVDRVGEAGSAASSS